jgi:TonB-dependent starch-binding outer membrane protein SusC
MYPFVFCEPKLSESHFSTIRQLGRTMKLTAFLITVACLQVSAHGFTQITLSETNAPLKKVFQQIEKQSGYLFWYNNAVLQQAKPVDIHVQNATLEEALFACFKEQPFTYSIIEKVIVIKEAGSKNQLAIPVVPPLLTVTGHITNEKGEPLAGATITVKGTKNATATNDDGSFSISDVPEDAVLVISSVGYEKMEIGVRGKTSLAIRLRLNVNSLDEMIVVAYGTITRQFNTGSVGKVTAEEIARQPVSNPLAALQGRVPGAFIQTQNGLPGGNVKVQIRGQGSIAAGIDPLYIVDGVPFVSTPLNTISTDFVNINGPVSPLNSINPADIESIEILKDADATAIYGSRAANGVVLITTKKGKEGKTKVNINIYSGASKISHFANYLNLRDYLAIRREAFTNDARTPTTANAPDLLVWDTTKSTDWQKYFFGGTAHVTEAQTSISGGNKNTNFMVGLTYRKEGTILPGNQNYSKLGGHLNLQHVSSNDNFSAFFKLIYTSDINTLIKSGDAVTVSSLPPNYPIYNPDGSLNWTSNNPFGWLRQKSKSETDNIITQALLKYRILKGLEAKLSMGYTKLNMDLLSTYPTSSRNPQLNPVGSAYYGNNHTKTYLLEPQLEYTRTSGKNNVKFLVGATWQKNLTEGFAIEGQNYTNEDLIENIAAAGTIGYKVNRFTEYKYGSLFGRINYIRDQKYLLSVNFRRDGSSKFGPGHQFGNFGSIGAGWIFTNEKAINSALPFLSYGKIRTSYGLTGNDQITPYQYLASYTNSSTPYQGNNTLSPSRIANSEYRWETNRKFEVALEIGALNNKLLATVAYFSNKSGNQLIDYTLPFTSGPFGSYQANLPALIVNSGWELELNSRIISNKQFDWEASWNITIPKNKLLKYPGLENSSYANTYVIGQDLSIVKGFNFTGVDPTTGIAQFEDIDHDGSITAIKDYVIFGKTSPDWYGGFNNNFKFKRLNFSFFVEFVKKYSYSFVGSAYAPGVLTNYLTKSLDRWRSAGDMTDVQKASASTSSPAYAAKFNLAASNAGFINTSYLRIKNISLSYDILSSKTKPLDLQVYLEAQNFFVITPSNIDPETINIINNTVPILKTFVAGLKLIF